ncbi:MAG: hypothetical protein QY325_04280 [Flavobacteriales bacterium]|nr:MAG: hypothetical protein QY325_04280 [Flavobacteriales bacterium]
MSEAASNGLLDGVEAAKPFDMDAYVDEVSKTPKQAYEPEWKAPEVEPQAAPPEDPTVAEARGKVVAKERARRRGSEMLIGMVDRSQAAVFTWFGAKGREREFRFRQDDAEEMTEYLAEALPEDFYLSPWIPLAVIMTAAIGANVAKLQEIRAENKRQADALARKAREEAAAAEQERMEREHAAQLRKDRDARLAAAEAELARVKAQQQAPPAAQPSATQQAPDGGNLCEECHTNPVEPGKRFCSLSCRGKANGRRSKAK